LRRPEGTTGPSCEVGVAVTKDKMHQKGKIQTEARTLRKIKSKGGTKRRGIQKRWTPRVLPISEAVERGGIQKKHKSNLLLPKITCNSPSIDQTSPEIVSQGKLFKSGEKNRNLAGPTKDRQLSPVDTCREGPEKKKNKK